MVVLLWKSSFTSMPDATEQVTMMVDGGTWRCAGYFVRPRLRRGSTGKHRPKVHPQPAEEHPFAARTRPESVVIGEFIG
jgi:hypothetical protein